MARGPKSLPKHKVRDRDLGTCGMARNVSTAHMEDKQYISMVEVGWWEDRNGSVKRWRLFVEEAAGFQQGLPDFDTSPSISPGETRRFEVGRLGGTDNWQMWVSDNGDYVQVPDPGYTFYNSFTRGGWVAPHRGQRASFRSSTPFPAVLLGLGTRANVRTP
jgi:hypothetical protein